jgi:hypothetical protein
MRNSRGSNLRSELRGLAHWLEVGAGVEVYGELCRWVRNLAACRDGCSCFSVDGLEALTTCTMLNVVWSGVGSPAPSFEQLAESGDALLTALSLAERAVLADRWRQLEPYPARVCLALMGDGAERGSHESGSSE